MTDSADSTDRTDAHRDSTDGSAEPVGRSARPGDADAAAVRDRMRTGIRAVRREGQKAALVHAAADAVLVLLLVNLALRMTEPASLPSVLPVPEALAAVGAPSTVDVAIVGGVVAGVGTFVSELALRLRRPLVEQFAAVNPDVSEALRTARDALESGHESRMATRLYADTVDRLRETSSLGLIDTRRLLVTFLLVALLAPASVHVTAVDYDLPVGGDGDGEELGPSTSAETEYEGLQNPDQVLGEPEDVRAGDRSVDTTLPTQGTGDGRPSPESYDSTGYSGGSVSVESQQAGFEEQERLEDAELIREYNLRIREEEAGADQ